MRFALLLLLPSLALAAPLTPRPVPRVELPPCGTGDLRVIAAVVGIGVNTRLADRDPDPTLDDLRLFPDAETVEAVIAWGYDHLRWVRGQAALDPDNRVLWWDYHCRMRGRLDAWRLLRDAQQERSLLERYEGEAGAEVRVMIPRTTYARVRDLRELRDRIGWMAFRNGRIGFPGAVEAFTSID